MIASVLAQRHFAYSALLPLALLAVTATPAAAGDKPSPEALQLTYKIAACLVKDRTDKARRVLAYVPGSDAESRAFLATEPGLCLGDITNDDVAVAMQDPFPRGAIAEYLLLNDFSSIGVPKRKASAIFAMPDATTIAKLKPMGQETLAGLAVAECVVRAEPQKSLAVFGTAVGSPEERAALTALLPAVNRCVPADKGMDMEMATLRALLGEAAYRVSVTVSQRA